MFTAYLKVKVVALFNINGSDLRNSNTEYRL